MANTPFGTYERTTAVLTWVLSIPFSLVAPLVVFMVCNEHPYAKRQAALALCLSGVCAVAAILLTVTFVGMLLLPLLAVAAVAVPIWGAVECSAGKEFSPQLLTETCRAVFKL